MIAGWNQRIAWTLEQCALLAVLWKEGKPVRAIAEALGTTRNSVIGKANRLHLAPRPSPIKREPKPITAQQRRIADEAYARAMKLGAR